MIIHPDSVHPHRRVFCNRTLNLRSLGAIGYDLDYTLVHYNVREWEGRAYAHIRRHLEGAGWPVRDLEFDPSLVMRGLVIDRELGNLLKVNRFGYVKAALHGGVALSWDTMRGAYSREVVDLAVGRYAFVNTLFSLSEACIYTQLVAMLDAGLLPGPMGYDALYRKVVDALNSTHVEGELKAEIMRDPGRFVELDPQMPITLLDQRRAGKKLLLITNSEWPYTRFMLDYAFDPYLPGAMTWRELFDLVVVSARKPSFFYEKSPIFRVIDDQGLLAPMVGAPTSGGIYLGGHADQIEAWLGIEGDRILYVGDHIYSDVNVSKKLQRWRTALVVRELERELRTIEADRDRRLEVSALMEEKMALEHQASAVRLALQRHRFGDPTDEPAEVLEERLTALRHRMRALDARVAPLVADEGRGFSRVWGHLLRAGNDKSHLTRQIERHADIYTSRVSNLLAYTPFAYFRSTRGTLPHDETAT